MKDGTYVVNYSLLGNPSFGTSSSSRSDISDDTSNWTTEKRFQNIRKNESGPHLPTSPELLEIVGADQENGDDEGAKKHWFRMLLDHVSRVKLAPAFQAHTDQQTMLLHFLFRATTSSTSSA